MRRDVAQAIVELIDRGGRGALATVLETKGSAPQVPGAKLLLRDDDSVVGTVGGGRIEAAVIGALRGVIEDGKPRRLRQHLGHDLGMCCGGEMELFCELVEGRTPLFVFGAGHVGRALVQIAEAAGFSATVIDPREDLATPERFPNARLVVLEPEEAISRLEIDERAFIVISTHDHRIDEDTLARCLPLPRRYLGMIGSRRKVMRVYRRIRHKGGSDSFAEVSAPIGLDLGALTPEEIAVSIVAEMIAVKRGGSGARMTLGRDAAALASIERDGE